MLQAAHFLQAHCIHSANRGDFAGYYLRTQVGPTVSRSFSLCLASFGTPDGLCYREKKQSTWIWMGSLCWIGAHSSRV